MGHAGLPYQEQSSHSGRQVGVRRRSGGLNPE